MATVTVSKNGGVDIPANLRQKYNLTPGTQIHIVDYGGVLTVILIPKNPVEQAAGMLKGSSSLTNTLPAKHKKELDGK